MRLLTLLSFQGCTDVISSKFYHMFFSLLVTVNISSDEISITFFSWLLHRIYQLSQLENISLCQSTIFFPWFNCHSITPNYTLLLFRRPHINHSQVLLILPEITQISALTAAGQDPTNSYWGWNTTKIDCSRHRSVGAHSDFTLKYPFGEK